MFSICKRRQLTVTIKGITPGTKRSPEEWHETFIVKEWHKGDDFPILGTHVGVDTETLRFSVFDPYPKLVVLGVYNPEDNTCYVIPYESADSFLEQLLLRDTKIYLANAGYDYYVLKEKMKDAVTRGKVIDILIRSQLYEISTVGFQLSYSLKDACHNRLGYEMDKHEEDGEASVRLTFSRSEDITEDQLKYLGIDCFTTWLVGDKTPEQITETIDTKGSIVLNRCSANGINVDIKVFDAFESALKEAKEVHRQQLITYGFPDPEKNKEEKVDPDDEWAAWQINLLRRLPEEDYNIQNTIPLKNEAIRLLLYALYCTESEQAPEVFLRYYVIIRSQYGNKPLKVTEKKSFDSVVDELECLGPLLPLKKANIWAYCCRHIIDKHLEGASLEEVKSSLDNFIQEQVDWFAVEPKTGPVAFLQEHLHKLQEQYSDLHLNRTKTGRLKCSKKDSWMFEDCGIKDPFMNAYVDYTHVAKYLSTYVNREYIKEDGKVHPKFGMVTSARTNCVKPNA